MIFPLPSIYVFTIVYSTLVHCCTLHTAHSRVHTLSFSCSVPSIPSVPCTLTVQASRPPSTYTFKTCRNNSQFIPSKSFFYIFQLYNNKYKYKDISECIFNNSYSIKNWIMLSTDQNKLTNTVVRVWIYVRQNEYPWQIFRGSFIPLLAWCTLSLELSQ